MDTELDYQIAIDQNNVQSDPGPLLPTHAQIETWIDAAFESCARWDKNQVTVRIVGEEEMSHLNQAYRHKQGPTNVLSFPFEAPEHVDILLLGDIVICAPVVAREASEQQKTELEHWAHMVVHGTLHLLGYDHITEQQARQMESFEINALSELGISNPYIDKTSTQQLESK